jgi:transposase InsO family protein
MSKETIREYFKSISIRYRKASKELKQLILNEFCATTGYNRKYAIRKLNTSPRKEGSKAVARQRKPTYGHKAISVLAAVWEAAGYPCSVRLKALLALWMPWIRSRYAISSRIEEQLLAISSRQIDRRLRGRKGRIRKRIYGRTKPGTLLKHHIPIKTDNWDVQSPGCTEVDTVSHSGNSGEGIFGYTVNQTDILTTWVESRAILGKGEKAVVDALDEMAQAFPFPIKGIDSDNGSEFINWHLFRYCESKKIQPSRGRPYKKDDNAHIEQKNWTHVRKLMGWERYDTQEAVDAMNDLYRNDLSLFMNLFLPSMKLQKKKRVGSKLTRVYDEPKTPLQRIEDSKQGDREKVEALKKLRNSIDPFSLAQTIENKLDRICKLANLRQSPKLAQHQQKAQKPLSKVEREAINTLSRIFPGLSISIGGTGKTTTIT